MGVGVSPSVHHAGFLSCPDLFADLYGTTPTGTIRSGTIRVNHQDARSLALGALRSRVGCVFQQEALFAAAIAENIRYGRAETSDTEMREPARLAGAVEFIERLPEGYATLPSRRGAHLSMGQKQRIAMARALLR